MPLPMVLATAVPNTKAAMKFQKAAHATARNGVKTRVDTTVAIELAASCQPFENSNASVRKITASSSENPLTARTSSQPPHGFFLVFLATCHSPLATSLRHAIR